MAWKFLILFGKRIQVVLVLVLEALGSDRTPRNKCKLINKNSFFC